MVAAARDACRRVGEGAGLLLLLDLDGTLATFKVDPKRVRLFPGMRGTLQRLLARPRTRLVIVTGRRASEAHGVVGLEGVDVVGLHGREVLIAGRSRLMRSPPRSRGALAKLLSRAREIAAGFDGLRVEDKRPGGVVLHTRGVSPAAARSAEARFVTEIRGARRDGIELLVGKRMAEARVGGATKGTAAATFARQANAAARQASLPPPVILFAGDDVTDEDAHRALVPFGALTILVASRPRPTAARYRVPSIAALKAVLDRFAC